MNRIFYITLLIIIGLCSNVYCRAKCGLTIHAWQGIMLPYTHIPLIGKPVPKSSQCVTGTNFQCCDQKMLYSMAHVSTFKIKDRAVNTFENILKMFLNDSNELTNLYNQNLETTKLELNKMFSKTYGYNYKTHRDFFYSWFGKLKSYMKGDINNIGRLLDTFFADMAERIVGILMPPNPRPEVLKCHTRKLIESKPYEDIDKNLRDTIKKAYPPARMVLNALKVGRDVFTTLANNIRVYPNCADNYNRVFQCHLCQNVNAHPCYDLCLKYMKECLTTYPPVYIKQFNKIFNRFIKKLIDVSARLDALFNFPNFNHKLNVQISTAIMNIQNKYPKLKAQIEKQCANVAKYRTTSGLNKRKKRSYQNNGMQNNNYPNFGNRNTNFIKPDSPAKTTNILSSWSRRILFNYKKLTNHFRDIPKKICTKEYPRINNACWNGTTHISYRSSHKFPIVNQVMKPKEFVFGDKLTEGIKKIKEITKKLTLLSRNFVQDPDASVVNDAYVPLKNWKEKFTFEGSGDDDTADKERFKISQSGIPKQDSNKIGNTNRNKNLKDDNNNGKVKPIPVPGGVDGSGSVETFPTDKNPDPLNMFTRKSTSTVTPVKKPNLPVISDDEDLLPDPGNSNPIIPDKPTPTQSSKKLDGSGVYDSNIVPYQPPKINKVTTKPMFKYKFSTNKPQRISSIKNQPSKNNNIDGSGALDKDGGGNKKSDFDKPNFVPKRKDDGFMTTSSVYNRKDDLLNYYPGEIPPEVWVQSNDGLQAVVTTPKKSSDIRRFSYCYISFMILIGSILTMKLLI